MTTWTEITDAVGLAVGGDREQGAIALRACWEDTSREDHAQRCVLAHYLADTEPALEDEVRWDERALAAHAEVRDDELAPVGIPSARGLAPSLHLNLGEGYRRQEDLVAAREQLAAGLAAVGSLADDGYGAMVRRGLDGLRERLEESEPD